MNITNKFWWSAVGCKLIETFISVKLWVLVLAAFFALQMLNIVIEIKEYVFVSANPELMTVLTNWGSDILDITIAMFTGVIVVVLLSREVFKHARIEKLQKNTEEKIKDNII